MLNWTSQHLPELESTGSGEVSGWGGGEGQPLTFSGKMVSFISEKLICLREQLPGAGYICVSIRVFEG